jgi:hypothetical protein
VESFLLLDAAGRRPPYIRDGRSFVHDCRRISTRARHRASGKRARTSCASTSRMSRSDGKPLLSSSPNRSAFVGAWIMGIAGPKRRPPLRGVRGPPASATLSHVVSTLTDTVCGRPCAASTRQPGASGGAWVAGRTRRGEKDGVCGNDWMESEKPSLSQCMPRMLLRALSVASSELKYTGHDVHQRDVGSRWCPTYGVQA